MSIKKMLKESDRQSNIDKYELTALKNNITE